MKRTLVKHKLKTNEIADIIIQSLVDRQFPIFLTSFSGKGFAEADVLGITNSGYMHEFEIKRSRADYFSEFKNKDYKHKRLKEGKAITIHDEWKKGRRTGNSIEYVLIPNRYFFVCENNLLNVKDIPEYAGLLYIVKGKLIEQKPAKLIHKNKANQLIYTRIANILSQRIIYGCSYYTHRLTNKK